MFRKIGLVFTIVLAGALAACNQQDKTYLELAGGGFVFNYRLAIAFVDVVLVTRQPLPEKATVTVTMENPAGGPLLVLSQQPGGGNRIEFATDPLTGVKANTDYAVKIRLVGADGIELQAIDKNFRSELDQSVLPPAPLTVGPGYTKNPDLPADPPKPQ